jgi:transposase
MVLVDGQGVPLGVHLASASPAEVTLAEDTIAQVSVPRGGPGRPRCRPKRIIADKAYDSDPLRKRLHDRQIELIAPHRKNRVRSRTQDGRKLRRYKHRWIVERSIGWLGNFRRILVRYDYHLRSYQAFLMVACMFVTLRRF